MSNDGYNASQSDAAAAAVDPMIGQIIDKRYKITHKLGEGGMGEVYAADHLRINRRLALKLLRAEVLTNEEAVKRFEQEAMTASSIGHENIIRIEDSGKLDDGRIYLAMELLDGLPFNDLLEQQDIGPQRLINILIQTCHGLRAAHDKNIIHRDMKPENIYITNNPDGSDLPKLLDFGIAKVSQAEGENHLTRTGTIFGTPFYMAPEQALGQTVDSRVDIYAMGVIMYEVFTGEVPFGGESFMGILTQHITSEPVPPSITAQNNGRVLPPGVEEVILKAMKKEPNERFQTMSELIEALIPLYRSVAGSGMSTYMAAHHPATGAMPTLENGQPRASTSADASQPFIPVGMAPGQMPMGPPGTQPPGTHAPGTHPPGTHPPGAHPAGAYPPGTQPPVAQAPGGYPPGTQPPAAYAPQNQGYNTGAAPSDSLMMPATNSRKGIFIMIAVVFLGAGGAAAWFLTRPKTDEVASKDTDKGNGGSDTVAVNAGGGPAMDAAVNLAIDSLSDAATSAATTPMDAGVAAVLADANTVAVAAIADAAPTVTPPDAKIADKPIVPKTRTILVDSKPAKAVIYRDGKRLGRAPMNIEVKAGETLSLIFKYKKHKDLQFSLDDSKGKVTAKLVRKKRNGGTRPGPDRTDPDRTPPKIKFCDRPGNQLKPRCMLE